MVYAQLRMGSANVLEAQLSNSRALSIFLTARDTFCWRKYLNFELFPASLKLLNYNLLYRFSTTIMPIFDQNVHLLYLGDFLTIGLWRGNKKNILGVVFWMPIRLEQ